jgi:hypothetical protein
MAGQNKLECLFLESFFSNLTKICEKVKEPTKKCCAVSLLLALAVNVNTYLETNLLETNTLAYFPLHLGGKEITGL